MPRKPRESKPYDPNDCDVCMDHYIAHPSLVAAAASVGIAHRRSTTSMLWSYLAAYHRSGHKAQGAGALGTEDDGG